MDTFQIVAQVVTLLVALYGAVVATILGYQRFRSDRLSVFVSFGWTLGRRKGTAAALTLEAVNDGRRDVVVSSLTLEIPGICRVTPAFLESLSSTSVRHQKEPAHHLRLRPGETTQAVFDNAALQAFVRDRLGLKDPAVRVRAVLEDTLENCFFSRWFELDEEPGPALELGGFKPRERS